MATYPNFTQALQDFGKVQVSDAKAGVPDTALATSIEYQVQGAGRFQPTVLFTMNDYGGFVDTGVVGTRNQRTQLLSNYLKKTALQTISRKIYGRHQKIMMFILRITKPGN